ncbi:hypothetical protein ACYFX5_08945 [Bremerella sp. T1]|uniref:hypothetical protein n=1 Tax=Bremerella sp. TYQ1 TaxID=3119568 RepID=UPI001CCC7422|nr:hypothetical protein [Bremerella volcania]UBM38381.1 hypothetical protein LA756_10875 [Bremerella volcania]
MTGTKKTPENASFVVYELEALRKSFEILIELQKDSRIGTGHGPNSKWEINIHLESFLLHFRQLRDFFYGIKNPHRDDLFATDFITDWDEECPSFIADLRGKLNASLAHISTQRSQYMPPNDDWELEKMTAMLRKTIDKFDRKCIEEGISSWFDYPQRLGTQDSN